MATWIAGTSVKLLSPGSREVMSSVLLPFPYLCPHGSLLSLNPSEGIETVGLVFSSSFKAVHVQCLAGRLPLMSPV